jgi:hypothetical protein
MQRIPTDNHIRTMLDPVPAETLFTMFDTTLAALEVGGGLASFQQRLGGHVLIALNGTGHRRRHAQSGRPPMALPMGLLTPASVCRRAHRESRRPPRRRRRASRRRRVFRPNSRKPESSKD